MSLRAIMILSVLAAGCAASSTSDPANEVDPAQGEESHLRGGKNDLAAAQQKVVLGLLNDACPDAWCKGEYGWEFKQIACDFAAGKTCTLTVVVTDPNPNGETSLTYFRGCNMTPVGSFDSLVETRANGSQSMTQALRLATDACVTKLEAGIHRR